MDCSDENRCPEQKCGRPNLNRGQIWQVDRSVVLRVVSRRGPELRLTSASNHVAFPAGFAPFVQLLTPHAQPHSNAAESGAWLNSASPFACAVTAGADGTRATAGRGSFEYAPHGQFTGSKSDFQGRLGEGSSGDSCHHAGPQGGCQMAPAFISRAVTRIRTTSPKGVRGPSTPRSEIRCRRWTCPIGVRA